MLKILASRAGKVPVFCIFMSVISRKTIVPAVAKVKILWFIPFDKIFTNAYIDIILVQT